MPATAEGQARRWHFANAVLDELKLELLIDGAEVEIERKPLQVLLYLLQHAGEVVTKEELLAAVWPGRILSDTALTKGIGRVREVLGDDDQAIIKTVYGYGYRLVAPVRVETQRTPERVHFNFSPGDRPPARPLWSLVRRLGAGGHGEAWLGKHDKTHEQRVFKFAVDEASLTALKREITLFRFLNDSLGERAPLAPLMDWNLEQPPCFIESQYIAGGSLMEWAERNGGLGRIPLATRLDVAAQIAEALSSVHSVGVLHKDLKPSNVFVQPTATGAASIRLGDFGSGGVLDARRLEALGITRLGFTHTVASLSASSGGTPMYLAPELLAGQPPTVQGDIYALGVMLYQLVIGEFRKAMSPGWERDIADELLREAIDEAAQGNPERRLANASALAHRLRTLEEERERRRQERETKDRAEALSRALEAAKASAAVADFLSKDLFATVGSRPLRDLTVRELLDAASSKLAHRFDDMPLAAAQIHAALGNAFWTMEATSEAETHLDRALELYEQMDLGGMEGAASAIETLLPIKFTNGKFSIVWPYYSATLLRARQELGAQHEIVLRGEARLAHVRFTFGHWKEAAHELQVVIDDAGKVAATDSALIGSARQTLTFCLLRLGQFESACSLADVSIESMTKEATLQVAIAQTLVLRGWAATELERHDQAEADLARALDLLRAWAVDDTSWQVFSVQSCLAQLRMRQQRPFDAIELLEAALKRFGASDFLRGGQDMTAESRMWLALAYRDVGRLDDAEKMMPDVVASNERMFGAQHPMCQIGRIVLADLLRMQSKREQIDPVLVALDRGTLEKLGPAHSYWAELRRLEGLLMLEDGKQSEAVAALTEALHSFQANYPASHPLVRRAESELGMAYQPPL